MTTSVLIEFTMKHGSMRVALPHDASMHGAAAQGDSTHTKIRAMQSLAIWLFPT